MIEFFKTLLSKINFKSDNEEVNKLNKIIYSVIILCAIAFIITLIYFVIKAWPSFMENVRYNWNESKSMFNKMQINQ